MQDRKTGARLERGEFERPKHTVIDAAAGAFYWGAVVVNTWTSAWGLAAAFSFPTWERTMFAVDDFVNGKFMLLGSARIGKVVFADKVSIYSRNYPGAAKAALNYGLRKEKEDRVKSAMASDMAFPAHDRSVIGLWGGVDEVDGLSLRQGLIYLQTLHGVDPFTAVAAMKTIEAAYEHDAKINS